MSEPRNHEHDTLVSAIANCTACRLCPGRTHIVVYRGNIHANIMLVGEAPGAEEDRTGLAFVGPSGTLIDKLLQRAGVSPEDIYFCNAVKCRPALNRTPTFDEVRTCDPFLRQQIKLVEPKVIITAGRVATTAVTGTFGQMNVLMQDKTLTAMDTDIPVIPIYHPAYHLRRINDPTARDLFQGTLRRIRQAWEVAQRVDLPAST